MSIRNINRKNAISLIGKSHNIIFTYILGRMGLFQRHDLHKFNVASVCRLVNEYNMMFAKVRYLGDIKIPQFELP